MAHKVRGVQRCCGSRSTRSPRSSIRCATQPDEKTTRSPGSRQSGPTTSCGRKRVAFGEPPCHRLNITFFILTITHCQHTGLAQQPDPLQIFYVLNNNTPYLPNPLPTRSMDNPARARQRGVRNARQAPAAAHRNDRPRPRPHAQRDNHGARHPPENLDHVGDHHGVLFAADICEAVLIARDMVSLVLATVFELLAKILLGCECSLSDRSATALTSVLVLCANLIFTPDHGWGNCARHVSIYIISLCGSTGVLLNMSGFRWWIMLVTVLHCVLRLSIVFATLTLNDLEWAHGPLGCLFRVLLLDLVWRVVCSLLQLAGITHAVCFHIPEGVLAMISLLLSFINIALALYPAVTRSVVTTAREVIDAVCCIRCYLVAALSSVISTAAYLLRGMVGLSLLVYHRLTDQFVWHEEELRRIERLLYEMDQHGTQLAQEEAEHAQPAQPAQSEETDLAWGWILIPGVDGERESARFRFPYPIPQSQE